MSRKTINSSPSVVLFLMGGLLLLVLTLNTEPAEASIGYFESYGWPTYGIVKPFWLAPFSSHPNRATSGYSRTHKTISAGVVKGGPFSQGQIYTW